MISQFISQIRTTGLARTNRYDAYLIYPDIITGDVAIFTNLFCESASLPGINVSTTPSTIYGEQREFPYQKMYTPLSLTFYVDSSMKVKKAFDQWINHVINPISRTINYYKSYTGTIELVPRNVDDSSYYSVIFEEVYPKSIQDIQLSQDSRDVMKLTVTFQYKYWRTRDMVENTPSHSGIQDILSIVTGAGYEYDAPDTVAF